jgi:hypothetical protein
MHSQFVTEARNSILFWAGQKSCFTNAAQKMKHTFLSKREFSPDSSAQQFLGRVFDQASTVCTVFLSVVAVLSFIHGVDNKTKPAVPAWLCIEYNDSPLEVRITIRQKFYHEFKKTGHQLYHGYAGQFLKSRSSVFLNRTGPTFGSNQRPPRAVVQN